MRLINADELIPLIKMGECNMYDEYCQGRNGGIEFAINRVKQMPTIEERKRGRWINENCSECGQYVYKGDARNFCPNCGAKMRGAALEEETKYAESGN